MLRIVALTVLNALLFLPVLISVSADAATKPSKTSHKLAGKMLTHSTGSGLSFKIYVTGDLSSDRAVLMVHERWGLNKPIKVRADQLGQLGYAVYAIDLFSGIITDKKKEARNLLLDDDRAVSIEKMKSAVDLIRSRHNRVGTLGWGFGGGYALLVSMERPVDATVVYYGPLEYNGSRLRLLQGPVLGIFGNQDGWIVPDKVDAFEQGLKVVRVPHQILRYSAPHAFANPKKKGFRLEPATDAWAATVHFLQENLK